MNLQEGKKLKKKSVMRCPGYASRAAHKALEEIDKSQFEKPEHTADEFFEFCFPLNEEQVMV